MTVPVAEDMLRSEPDEFHLACLLLCPSTTVYLGDALERVDPDDFWDPTLGQLWRHARVIHASGARVTKRALLAAADADTTLLRVRAGQVAVWLTRVAGEPAYPTRIPTSIRAVRDTARLRRLVQAAETIKQSAFLASDYSQALEGSWDVLRSLTGSEVDPEVLSFSELFDEWQKQMAGGLSVGEVVPTPWPALNELLSGGLHPGRSYLVAARPAKGKTTAGLNIAACAAEQGFTSLVVSQEMTNFEVTGKVLAAGGHAEYGEIVRYSMSDETAYRVTEYGETNRNMPLYSIDKTGLTIEYVSAVAKSMKRTKGLDLAFIDYLQLLRPTNNRGVREQEVSHISGAIKQMSRELKCAVVTAAQLNRGNVKTNRRPAVDDLRESGSLEQDADVVILLHHELTEDDRPTGEVVLIVGKNRFGREDEVVLPWRGHQARIG